MISVYIDFIRMRFLTMLAYRVNYYSGIAIYAINIGSAYFIWKAVYGDNVVLGGMTSGQVSTYIAISWMARAFYFNNLDQEISREIRDGSVAIQMIRPYQYLTVKMMQGLGEGLFRLLLFSIPGMLIVVLLFPIRLPTDPLTWLAFSIMIMFSFFINSQINILTGLSAFFLENNEGLMRMKRVAIDLFSGLVIPLTFFPGWAERILKLLPFQAITYLPGSVFTGNIVGTAIVQAIGVQIFWFIALLLPLNVVWRRARKRLFVQGG
jgi:ABC-2 type transport system permease protein